LCEIAESLGEKFDFWNTFLLGFKCWFKLWLKAKCTFNINRSPHKLNCTEAVINFLNFGKYKAVVGLQPDLTSPGELLGAVLKATKDGKDKEFKTIYLQQRYLAYDGKILLPKKLLGQKFDFFKDRDIHTNGYLQKMKSAPKKC